MKRWLWLALLLLPCAMHAQVVGPGFINYVTSAPSGACSQGEQMRVVIGLGTVYTCQSGTWTQVGGGAGGVTSVTGTPNQITSSSGTTPVLSIPSTFVGPGSITATTFLASAVGSQLAVGVQVGSATVGLWNTGGSLVVAGAGTFFNNGATNQWTITGGGELQPGSDNGHDLGDAGARVRTVFAVGTALNTLGTTTNCSNAGAPAVCAAAPSGVVAVPTGVNPTLVVNTTAVTANSRIFLEIDESATIAATTCNTTLTTLVQPVVTARTAATSFTIQIGATLATNPACVSYFIVN